MRDEYEVRAHLAQARRQRAQERRAMRRWAVAAAVAAVGIAGAGIADAKIQRDEVRDSIPNRVVACVLKVWEDGSASFRDAEAVYADRECRKAIIRYVNGGK